MASSIPKVQSGIVIEETGGPEVLKWKEDLAVPEPKEGEVLVRNEVLGVNYIDTYFRTGLYPAPSYPHILGREASGTIVAVGRGETYNLSVGDRVVYMGTAAYAQYTSVPSLHVAKIPAGIASDVAAASLLQGLTALTLIRESHKVEKGDWVLVHAAAGGVGLLLCQLLKALGAHAIGTVSTPEKAKLAKKNGAEVVINYGTAHEGVEEKVKEITRGKGVIAVFDGVGKATFDASLNVLSRKGSLVSFGNASGAVPPVTISRLSPKGLKLLRPTLFAYIAERGEFEHYADELFEFLARGELDVRVHEVYPLKEVARAHQDIEGRKTTGKLLLKP